MKPQDESKQYISQNPCSDYLKKARAGRHVHLTGDEKGLSRADV